MRIGVGSQSLSFAGGSAGVLSMPSLNPAGRATGSNCQSPLRHSNCRQGDSTGDSRHDEGAKGAVYSTRWARPAICWASTVIVSAGRKGADRKRVKKQMILMFQNYNYSHSDTGAV